MILSKSQSGSRIIAIQSTHSARSINPPTFFWQSTTVKPAHRACLFVAHYRLYIVGEVNDPPPRVARRPLVHREGPGAPFEANLPEPLAQPIQGLNVQSALHHAGLGAVFYQ